MLPTLTVPRPIQLVVDDVGWREGWDLSETGGPFRAGVDRLLGRLDYEAVADLGEALGIRPQCAMVMCEWDMHNVCAGCPTATQSGAAWDNTARVGPWMGECAEVFRTRSAHIELALHGVGHEHWEQGQRTRAEWFGQDVDDRWPWDVVQTHIACFTRLIDQHGLGPATGMSFPPSFVPCAFRFYWDNADPESTGALVASAGVRYASTPYSSCTFAGEQPERPDGGFEHGVLVLDRGSSGIPWFVWDTVPEGIPTTSICGIHWPNLLTPSPRDNGASVARWCEYLSELGKSDGLMLARSMSETCSQWIHSQYTTIQRQGNDWCLDTSGIPVSVSQWGMAGPPVVSLPLGQGGRVPALRCEGGRIVARWEDDGHAYFGVRLDEAGRCRVHCSEQEGESPCVRRSGTYNVLDLRFQGETFSLGLELFGRQRVPIRGCGALTSVAVAGAGATVHAVTYDTAEQEALIDLSVDDIQGRTLTVTGKLARGS
ncbi:MAG: hypothetical protein HN742_40925 [Lentisphaerae bacterium]|jgi:hypothetical protein|nr:hypothetical protein [Lentisphaerota bacterium]MBT4823119.1 hypothetical protein [Lentisphaerota bacterium]MBT5610144.1 hypothetical protein [Lentisphaerota bacterium]MBT7056948.1 hypothetical protein [Lentisphaerota bacterium]MBT7848300.1 hypothetical protein [Lentisphaerota bacterium]